MKKAILLLHGWLSDPSDFVSLIPKLKSTYDYIESLTYVGHGDDDPFNFDSDKTFELLHNTFKNLQLNYEIIDVVGFSLGGALAVYLSQHYAFNKLVLLAPANKYLNFRFTLSRLKHLFKCLYMYQKAVIAKDEEQKELYKMKLRNVFEDDKVSLGFVKEKYLRKHFRKSFKQFRKIIKTINLETKEIKNPLFIAWGKFDQLVPHSSARDLYDICSNDTKKFVVYEEMSHTLIISKNNEKLVNDIINFLNS